MAQIKDDKTQSLKEDVVEIQLTDYIKYLVGEKKNDDFKLKREDFA